MTEKEMILNVLHRFSSCSSVEYTLSNGNTYVEGDIGNRWLGFEFNEAGEVVEIDCGG